MAENSYCIYVKNDGSGNLQCVAYRSPSTIPSCASSGASLPVPYINNSWLAGSLFALSAATNAAPIVVTVAAGHGLVTGDEVFLQGVTGNTAANGSWLCTVSGNSVTLTGSLGNGAYTNASTAPGYIQKVTTTKNLFDALQAGVIACQADKAAGN